MTGERGSTPPGTPPREDEPADADVRGSGRPRSGPPAPAGTWTAEVSSADSDRVTEIDLLPEERSDDHTLPFGGPDLPVESRLPTKPGFPPPRAIDAADDSVAEADTDAESPSTVDDAAAAGAAAEASVSPEQPEDASPTDEAGIENRYYGMTDVGLVREHNEDNFLVADVAEARRGLESLEAGATHATAQVHGRGAIYAVCDGMGGAAAGEVASQMAVDTIYEFFVHLKQPNDRDHFARRIVASIEEAGNRIFSAAKMDRTRRGMGTTATVAGLIDKVLFVGQVGDSRAYVLRNGKLTQITKDQSLVNQLIEAGQLTEDEAEAFEHSNIILQALGTTEEVTVDLTFLELRRGDRLMMCSDGLSGLVHPDVMTEVLVETADLSEACSKLIEMANVGGGHDNITVVCVDFSGEGLTDAAADDDVVYQQYPLPTGLPDDRESLPLREPRMKSGGPKPGADVKRELTGPVHGRAEGGGADGESRLAAFLMVAALMILVVLAAAALAFYVSRAPDSTTDVSVQVAGPTEEAMPLPEMVGVSIDTDIDGELWIDGELFGPMSSDEQLIVRLEPGAYRVEARFEGAVLASELVTVEVGGTPSVSLHMPTGTDGSETEPTTERPEPPETTEQPEARPGERGSRDEAVSGPPASEGPSRSADRREREREPRSREPRARIPERPTPRMREQSPPAAEPLPDNPFD